MTEQQRQMLLRRFRAHQPTVAPTPDERPTDEALADDESDAPAPVAA
jgi:hypothetical protein